MNAIFLHLKIMALYLCDIRQEHMNQLIIKQKSWNISPIYRYKNVHASSTFMCLKKKAKSLQCVVWSCYFWSWAISRATNKEVSPFYGPHCSTEPGPALGPSMKYVSIFKGGRGQKLREKVMPDSYHKVLTWGRGCQK